MIPTEPRMSSKPLPDRPTTLEMYDHYVGHTKGDRLPAAILALAEAIRSGAWHVGQGIGDGIEDISPIRVDAKVNGHIGVEAPPSKRGNLANRAAAKERAAKKQPR